MDKSLVLVAEQDGEARYRLLETVRQYGRVKLEEAGDGAGASRRHADLFLKPASTPSNHRRHPMLLEQLLQIFF